MEMEFFCEPDTDLEWFAYWKKYCIDFLKSLGMKEEEMRVRDHDQEELSYEGIGAYVGNDYCERTESEQDEAQKDSDVQKRDRGCIPGFPAA